MTTVLERSPRLEEFLQLPETKPASEFIDGKIIQKPIPQGEHSQITESNLSMSLTKSPKHPEDCLCFSRATL